MKLVDQLLQHAQALRFEVLPAAVVQAATSFITDSVAVGLAGSRHPRVAQVRAAANAWGASVGAANSAREWVSGTHWPAATAALLNAYQIHNQEYDCVHELAVVHPLATLLPALVAQAESMSAAGQPISGERLIEAVVLAVDVATTIGSAQIAPMRFFRPAMCGALGASLGLAKLAGCDKTQMADTLGITYSQLAGTMQAHVEGSPMLALQVGMAARATVVALGLAQAGFSGPRDVIEGPFGYFDLFDAPLAPRLAQVQAEFDHLGKLWRVTQISHKPYPTGRAAQGALDGIGTLQAQHGFQAPDVARGVASDVAHVELAAPPLILRLIGRPWRKGMDVNYARLCLPYLAATALLKNGPIDLDDFSPAALANAEVELLAQRVTTQPNHITDPNALAPQSLTITLNNGSTFTQDLPTVLGHPLRPLSATAQRAKFDHCCNHAGMAPDATARLHKACEALAHTDNVARWVDLMRVA
jgi:aconitate decarboxylase